MAAVSPAWIDSMEFATFWATVGANILANALTLLYLFAIAKGARSEREHGDWRDVPPLVIFMGLLGPIVGAACIYVTFN